MGRKKKSGTSSFAGLGEKKGRLRLKEREGTLRSGKSKGRLRLKEREGALRLGKILAVGIYLLEDCRNLYKKKRSYTYVLHQMVVFLRI